MKTAEEWIRELNLVPHPEGGYYKETYRSAQHITSQPLPSGSSASRNICTTIYYLLPSDHRSHFHRIQSDEIWYFHAGAPLTLVMIQENKIKKLILGNNPHNGEHPQLVIPGNTWFGAYVENEHSYCLCSCSVSPGFDYADFELAEQKSMLEGYPDFEKEIRMLTRP